MLRMNILGVAVNRISFRETIETILGFVKKDTAHQIVTVNPEFILEAQANAEFRTILNHADLALADGTGLLWASRVLRKRNPKHPVLSERVAGSDVVVELFRQARTNPSLSFYLLGGSQTSTARVQASYPNVQILGQAAGPRFSRTGDPISEGDKKELDCILADIRQLRPSIVLVGLGAPKQEFFIDRYLKPLGVPVSIGVGGTFEYLAGELPRAPRWLQASRLEWLWRLLLEPGRFGRVWNAVVRFPLTVLRSK